MRHLDGDWQYSSHAPLQVHDVGRGGIFVDRPRRKLRQSFDVAPVNRSTNDTDRGRIRLHLGGLSRDFHHFGCVGDTHRKAVHRCLVGVIIQVEDAGLESRNVRLCFVVPSRQTKNHPPALTIRGYGSTASTVQRSDRNAGVGKRGARGIDDIASHLSGYGLDVHVVGDRRSLRQFHIVERLLTKGCGHEIRGDHIASKLLHFVLLREEDFPAQQADGDVHVRQTQLRATLFRERSAGVHEYEGNRVGTGWMKSRTQQWNAISVWTLHWFHALSANVGGKNRCACRQRNSQERLCLVLQRQL